MIFQHVKNPIHCHFLEKQEVEKEMDLWLKERITTKSYSDYCSPIVVCRKKNRELHYFCRLQINKKIIKDKYPLSIINEIFNKLGNGKVFMTLDLKNAFFYVDINGKVHF